MYMVTGVMFARGAHIKEALDKRYGGSVHIGIDPTGTSALTVGPKVDLSAEDSQTVTYQIPETFVFAFRVSKVRVKKKTGDAKVADYVKGAMYSNQKEGGNQTPEGEIEVMGVEEEDTAPEKVGLESMHVGEQDGEIYHCCISDAA